MLKETDFSLANLPKVTIAIPTYNEAENIENLINSFLNSTYSNIHEILVGDGGSDDQTEEIVEAITAKNSQVKLIKNPQKIQAYALNLMLNAAKGDIFLRADAHCNYAPDYIEKCVKTLMSTEAQNSGGAQRFVAKKSFQSGIALASKSLLGSGGAPYRNPEYNGYADTVFLGCMWKQALLDVGGYSNQVTNEDAELNQRFLAKNPQSIYVSSEIKVWYYPRETWRSLWNQYFKYGRGRYLTANKHDSKSQLRGKLPFLFVSLMGILLSFDLLFSAFNLYMKELSLFLFLLALGESLRVNITHNKKFIADIWRGSPEQVPSFVSRTFSCWITILTMPIAHFSGYGYQLFRNRILRIQNW